MRKLLCLVLAVLMLLGSAAALAQDGEVLVLYASTPEPYLTDMIKGYEAATGIKVELVSAGTSELYKRVLAEGDEPMCDVLRGGMMWGSYVPIVDNLMAYDSPLNDTLPADCQKLMGSIYGFNYIGSCLMINNAMLAELGVEVKGYKDLLQPELKGKVTMPDPTQTSSGWEQVVNMLFAMGGGDTEEGWAYVNALMENGLVLNGSSSGTHKSVADGEYAVALVCESMVTMYIEQGLDVSIVWMEEGVVMNSDGIAIVKNCPHPESAKKFIDFLLSRDFQNKMLEAKPQLRPVLSGLDVELKLTPIEDIPVISCDYEYLSSNKAAMLDHMKDIMTNFM